MFVKIFILFLFYIKSCFHILFITKDIVHTRRIVSFPLLIKIVQKAFNVDYEEFRKSIGLYIRNTRTLDVYQEAVLRAMIRNIRRDVNEDPDKMDTSYEIEDSFLSAYGDNDENDPGDDTLSATSRKTLALNLMKVFREDVPKLAVLQRNHYVCTTLYYLRIGKNEWKNFHVST